MVNKTNTSGRATVRRWQRHPIPAPIRHRAIAHGSTRYRAGNKEENYENQTGKPANNHPERMREKSSPNASRKKTRRRNYAKVIPENWK
jgi:hypothetical protein